jgi:cyclophilin family peptidyl-prolyl cis-trans isomerase
MAMDRTRHDTPSLPLSAISQEGQGDRHVRPCLEALEEREVLSSLPTVGAFDPSSATWYLRNSNSAGAPDAGTFAYGTPGSWGVTGDWDGNGSSTVGVVDPKSMTWYLRNSNSAGAPDAGTFAYGAPGWIPVVGDWNGDGHTGIGAYDPSTATWYLRNEANAGAPDAGVFRYGVAGWLPVVGDWTGQGQTTIGVVDPTSMTWYLRNQNSAGAPDAAVFRYGSPGWVPVVGDWNGDGTTTVGVVDPRTETWYLSNSNSVGGADAGKFAYGAAGWFPVVGAWDGTRAPFVHTPIDNVKLASQGSTVLDLAGNFDDVTITNSIVRFNTSSGPINVELFDRQAPRTVANFLNYVTDNQYDNSIFHRSESAFVLQGGGFTYNDNPSRLTATPTSGPIQNEPDPVNRSNLRGTIAMAKVEGNPNSATDQFFFNLADNSSNLDNQNGGFTVFGKVLGQTDLGVMDALGSIPTHNEGSASALPPSQQGVFTEIPLQNYSGNSFPADTTAGNYALINSISVVRRTDSLTYTVVSNNNPAVLSTSMDHNQLTLTAGQSGTAVITVRATNQSGASVQTSFQVTVT